MLAKQVNQSATFHCPGLKVTWKYHKGPLPDDAVVGPANINYNNKLYLLGYRHWHYLKIDHLLPHHSGDYQCYSENHDHTIKEGKAVLHVTCELEYFKDCAVITTNGYYVKLWLAIHGHYYFLIILHVPKDRLLLGFIVTWGPICMKSIT